MPVLQLKHGGRTLDLHGLDIHFQPPSTRPHPRPCQSHWSCSHGDHDHHLCLLSSVHPSQRFLRDLLFQPPALLALLPPRHLARPSTLVLDGRASLSLAPRQGFQSRERLPRRWRDQDQDRVAPSLKRDRLGGGPPCQVQLQRRRLGLRQHPRRRCS